MTNDQCRAARVFLGLSQKELAKVAAVGPKRLQGFETGAEVLSAKSLAALTAKLRRVFLAHGIEFLNDEQGIGLRRRRTVEELIQAESSPAAVEPAKPAPDLPVQTGPITAEQCRAARGFLAWSQGEAAAALGVGLSTIVGLENKRMVPHARTAQQIRSGFESRGLVFSDAYGRLVVGWRAAD
jgi:transcriptional regulator with XRE-family HTH domain